MHDARTHSQGVTAGNTVLPGASPFHSAAAPSSLATVTHVPRRPLQQVHEQHLGWLQRLQVGQQGRRRRRRGGHTALAKRLSPVLGRAALRLKLQFHLGRICRRAPGRQ